MPYEYEQDKERRGGVPARGLSDAKTAEERDSATGGRETTKIAESGKRGAPTQLPYLAELERSLGADLKGIRAYSGRSASEASERLDAQAYTHRGDVVLGQGADKRVVAEEAAHALQQTRLQGAQQSYGITAVESSAEVEARGAADATLAGVSAQPLSVGLGHETVARAKGSNKNSKHANEAKREEAMRKYLEKKAELDALKATPNKTPEIKEQIAKLEREVKHLKSKADFTGEHHSQNAKGNG